MKKDDVPELIEVPEDNNAHPITLGQIGMWVFISSEVMFFAALIGVAIIFRLSTLGTAWPNAEEMHTSLGLGMLNTIFLVASGITAFAAARAAWSDRPQAAKLMLIVTMLLGMLFLGIKFREYSAKYRLGLLPSASGQQIYQEANREYVSAVDQRLQTIVADLEQKSETDALVGKDKELLELLYELRTYMTGYTANNVGQSTDPNRQEVQMRLMAHQIFQSVEPTTGMEEILAVDLTNFRSLRDRFLSRLELAHQRTRMVGEQISDLEETINDAVLLGTTDPEPGDRLSDDPEKWLGVKQEQLTQLNVEIEKLELSLAPIQGRINVLEYLADPRYEDGFNAALGLRLPVVITNGQSWMNVYLLLTGMHALHLIAGLVLFLWYLPRRLDRKRSSSLYVAAMYWQFVDIVWLTIFSLIYF